MKIRRVVLAACTAFAAVAALAPAAQAEWTHNTEGLTQDETIHFHGTVGFGAAGIGSFGCQVHGTLKATPGSTGHLTTITPITNTCVGTGAYTGCIIETHEFSSGEAHVTTGNSPDITITDFTIKYLFEAGTCLTELVNPFHLEFPTITLTPEGGHHPLNAVTILGTDLTKGAVTSGTLRITPENTFSLST